MAKRRKEPVKTQTSNTPLIAMVVAAVVVIAAVAWALSRSVQPTPTPVPEVAQQTPPAVDTSTFTAPPVASTTAWTPGAPAGTSQPTLTPPPVTAAPPITATPQSSGTAGVPRIAAEDLKSQFDRGAVTIIDVRDATSYAQGHIPGALHIPMASIQTEIPNLPKNKPIVTYCT